MTMPIEFERKFLLRPDRVADVLARATSSEEIQQGYFMEDGERCVRIRQRRSGWVLTFKSSTNAVGKVVEIETPLPEAEAVALLALCRTRVHKRRHILQVGEFTWEIDQFLDHNAGLVLAEVELADDAQSGRLTERLPAWVDREVTGQPEYFNTWLAANTLPRA